MGSLRRCGLGRCLQRDLNSEEEIAAEQGRLTPLLFLLGRKSLYISCVIRHKYFIINYITQCDSLPRTQGIVSGLPVNRPEQVVRIGRTGSDSQKSMAKSFCVSTGKAPTDHANSEQKVRRSLATYIPRDYRARR
jgi:hypothetical protein